MIDLTTIDSWIGTADVWLTSNPEIFLLILIWQIVWMGIALWISARKKHIVWFIIFLVIHTLGILDILYIFWFSKIGLKKRMNKSNKRKKR